VDPIYYQVNQSRLTENTQKSSDNLRIQQNKEARRKSEKAGEVDKSGQASDLSSMSDDMLGDMDPDDYGGQGAQQFAQMWKEQFTEKPEKDEPEDLDEDSEDSENSQDSEYSEEEKEEELPQDEQVVLEDEVPLSAEPESAQGDAPRTCVPASPEPQAEPVAQSSAVAVAEAAQPEPRTPEKAVVAAVPVQAPKGLASLLDFSNGFLIAEEAQWDVNASDVQTAPEVVVEEEVLDEDISIILERMVGGDSSQPTYRKLCQLLSRFGRSVLQMCSESQTKVYLLPPGEPLMAHPQLHNSGYNDLKGAAYLPQNRLCLVEDECLAEAPHGFHPLFFYFGHAFDHALGGESFASLKSPAVRASYLACLDGAHRFGDLMAAHSPAHYFAQAVESYLAENDCFEPFWTRQDLYDFDRSMYDYVEYLLRVKR